ANVIVESIPYDGGHISVQETVTRLGISKDTTTNRCTPTGIANSITGDYSTLKSWQYCQLFNVSNGNNQKRLIDGCRE
ncbi:MAG: hypothetical protein SO082_02495, partial [Candidatus Limisoma sp.]|nr:hypothetical protein [Candidatus Limisoma sp.]